MRRPPLLLVCLLLTAAKPPEIGTPAAPERLVPETIRCDAAADGVACKAAPTGAPCVTAAASAGILADPAPKVMAVAGEPGFALAIVAVHVVEKKASYVELHAVGSDVPLGPALAIVRDDAVPVALSWAGDHFDLAYDPATGGGPKRLTVSANGNAAGAAVAIDAVPDVRPSTRVESDGFVAECTGGGSPAKGPLVATIRDPAGHVVAGPETLADKSTVGSACTVACQGSSCLFTGFSERYAASGSGRHTDVDLLDLAPGTARHWPVEEVPYVLSTRRDGDHVAFTDLRDEFGTFGWIGTHRVLITDGASHDLLVQAEDPHAWSSVRGAAGWVISASGAEGYDVRYDADAHASQVVRTTATCH
jgi:hypothetical protein